MQADEIRIHVLSAVEEFNASLAAEERLPKDLATPLIGEAGRLDSVGLVSLIVLLEEKLQDATGRAITIADERAFSQEKSPFLTLGSLSDYAALLLSETSRG